MDAEKGGTEARWLRSCRCLLSTLLAVTHNDAQVNQEKKWADVGRLLGYGGIPGLSTQLRNSYIRVILPYEHYSERVKSSVALSPAKKKDTKTPTPASAGLEHGSQISPLSSPSMSSSPLSEPPDDEDGAKKGPAQNGTRE